MSKQKPIAGMLAALLGAGSGLIPASSTAAAFTVSLDTSALSGSYSIVFDLLNGDAIPNNSVTLENFAFGGGGPSGVPTYTCTSGTGAACAGVSGDLSTSVTLNDSADFLNEFTGAFTAGTTLSFIMTLSDNFAGGSPDSFLFSLLDSGGNVIPTSDPLGTDTFLYAENASPLSIQTFDSPSAGIPAPVAALVPEIDTASAPGVLALLGGSLGLLAEGRRRGKAGGETG